MNRRALLAALAGVLLAAPVARAQGDLRRIQASFHPGPKFFLPKPPEPAPPTGSGLGGAGEGAGYLAAFGVLAVTAPVWGPHELWDRGFDAAGWFPNYPGALHGREYLTTDPSAAWVDSDLEDEHHVKPWAVRGGLEVGDDFGGLRRVGGQLFLDTDCLRLGLLADWNEYLERLPGVAGTDRALVSDYNLTWRVTQCDWFLAHLGAGVRLWRARGQTDLGPNFLYRADTFVAGVHASGLLEAGTVRTALVLHGQVQIGYVFQHGEAFVGYDLLRVKTVPLHSPTVGVRLWF